MSLPPSESRPLTELGWTPNLAHLLQARGDPELVPARVCAVDRGSVEVLGLAPEPWVPRRCLPRPRRQVAVGDWLARRSAGSEVVREQLLPRRSVFARKAPGRSSERQLLAANIDVVLVVTALGEDFSLRRVQRYVSAARAGGAAVLVVVSKADRPHDAAAVRSELQCAVLGMPVGLANALTPQGLDELRSALPAHATLAFAGSSGVGKSTLINRLLGLDAAHEQKALAVRDGDDKGRHAATRRSLLPWPAGWLLIDTPGLREFGLVHAEARVAEIFADAGALSAECHFRDCRHAGDPGCALEKAVAAGEMPAVRLAQHKKAWEKDIAREIRRWKKGERQRGGKGG